MLLIYKLGVDMNHVNVILKVTVLGHLSKLQAKI